MSTSLWTRSTSRRKARDFESATLIRLDNNNNNNGGGGKDSGAGSVSGGRLISLRSASLPRSVIKKQKGIYRRC